MSLNFTSLGSVWEDEGSLSQHERHQRLIKHFSDSIPYVLWTHPPQTAPKGGAMDFFAPEWEQQLNEKFVKVLKNNAAKENMIGIYLSNELHWMPDHRRPTHILDEYMQFDADAPGKLFVVEFMETYYEGNIEKFNEVWEVELSSFDEIKELSWLGPKSFFTLEQFSDFNVVNPIVLIKGLLKGFWSTTWSSDGIPTLEQATTKYQFAAAVAEKWYGTLHALVKQHAPNHMILGSRQYVWGASAAVTEVVAKYSDVYSVNPYTVPWFAHVLPQTFHSFTSGGYDELLVSTGFGIDLVSDLMNFSALQDKPIMLSELFIGADQFDFQNANTIPGAYSATRNQNERTELVEIWLDQLIQSDQVVGYSFHNWVDDRLDHDGERMLAGFVDETGVMYPFAYRVKEINKWWLLRLQATDQSGPENFDEAPRTKTVAPGSLKRIGDDIRDSFDIIIWGLDAWFQQSFYSMIKTIQTMMAYLQLGFGTSEE